LLTQLQSKNFPNNEDVHILIVDDDPIVLEVMKSFIASYGYNFQTATDGLNATEVMKTNSFDIVLSDINMPNMDGMDLLKYVKIHHPHTGVILITGLSEEYSYVDVINEGAIDYMTKPFDGNELLAKLQRVLREQKLISELEQISIKDSLTNLYNRRYFDIKVPEEVHRANRQKYSAFLAFIDVDNFKGYNDTFGHQSGDNLLSTTGNILLSCARKGVDWAFRYGGDEFAILITQTTKSQTMQISERIIKTYNDYQFGSTSISIGVTKFILDPNISWKENINIFLKKADQALYKVKESGKNKTIFVA